MRDNNIFKRHPVLTSIGIIFVWIGCLELVLRLFFSHLLPTEPSDFMLPNAQTHHDYVANVVFTRNPGPGDTFKPAINRINSFGIRGPEIPVKSTYRILNIGDSFIQADEVEFEDTFSELLNQTFKGQIEFIAHGMGSWSPTTEFSWIHHKGLRLKPDEINLFLCVNDFYRREVNHSDAFYRQEAIYDASVPVGYRLPHAKPTMGTKFPFLRRVGIIRLVRRTNQILKQSLKRAPGQAGDTQIADELILLSRPFSQWPPDITQNVDATLKVVNDLNQYLKTRGIRLNVLLVPLGFAWKNENVIGKMHPDYGWTQDFTVSQEGIEDYLKVQLVQYGIPYISLKEEFAKEKLKYPDLLLFNEADGHWNRQGHRIVYQALRQHYQYASHLK